VTVQIISRASEGRRPRLT